MFSFHDFFKALLPDGSLWRPFEQYLVQNPEPNLIDGDMEAGLGPELLVDGTMEAGPGPEELVDGDMEKPVTYGPEELIDGDMEAGPGPEELVDGNMEAADTSAWSAGNSATLTKETGTPHGGARCLRVAYNAVNNPYAYQTILTIDRSYRVTGWGRSDGTALPRAREGTTVLWTGSTSTSWQSFDITFVATSTRFDLVSVISAAGYAEFDDVSVKETCPDWTPGSSATLTKETGTPHGGVKCLRVAYNGTPGPYAYQTITTAGLTYRITGWARGDGGAAYPYVRDGANTLWTGTTSNSWQFFDVTYVAGYAQVRLSVIASAAGYGEFDDCSVKELLFDWTVGNSALLSKETDNPVGGSYWLKVAYNGVNNPYAYQTIVIVGRTYRITGWSRADGSSTPEIKNGTTSLWIGLTGEEWNQFDVTFVATATDIRLVTQTVVAGFAGFDQISCKETCPDWDSANNAELTKEEIVALVGTDQVLRVAYDGSNNPYAYQSPLLAGRTYRIIGQARGDGTHEPRIRDGTGVDIWVGASSTIFQDFEEVFIAPNTDIRFYVITSSSGYAEFNSVSVKEEASAWTSGNDALLTKETILPQAGLQCLRITYDGTNDPYAEQTILNVSQKYKIKGYAKSDGKSIPQLYAGSVIWEGDVSTEWQPFEFIFAATATQFRLITETAISAGEFCEFDTIEISAIQPTTKAHFDLLLAGIGDNFKEVYNFLKNLAYIRDPHRTVWLDELEKEYGFIKDTDLTEQERRDQIAALKYAKRGSGSWDDLEDLLNNAGFDVEVRNNDPAVDPLMRTLRIFDPIISGNFLDYYAEYLGGLQDPTTWSRVFWICASSVGWPYTYGSDIHTYKNHGELLFYSDYFTHLTERDYSKYRDENVTAQNIVKVDGDGIKFDNFSGNNLLADGNMEAGLGLQELADYLMEKSGTSDWTAGNSATLSKQGGAYEGVQCLRVAYNGVSNPYAYQNVLIATKTYKITGWARGNGTYVPSVQNGATVLWTGSSSTTWQYFDLIFVASAQSMRFYSSATAAGYCEFDAVEVRETCPLWGVGASAKLEKETSLPKQGNQFLRVSYNGTSNPYADQDILTNGVLFRARGWARSDGIFTPRLREPSIATHWIGTTSKEWQYFDVLFVAGGSTIALYAGATSSGYCDFDQIIIEEANQQSSRITINHDSRFNWADEFTLVFLADFQLHSDGEVLASRYDLGGIIWELRLGISADKIVFEDDTSIQTIGHNVVGDKCLAVSGKNGSALEAFIDGSSIGNFSGTVDVTHANFPIFIGNNQGGTNAFQSTMRAALIFDRILTSQEHSDLYTELNALETPAVTAPTLTDNQIRVIKNLVVKFKPLKSWGLLAIEDHEFTFTNTTDYPGDSKKGFSGSETMNGGRFINSSEV